MARPVEPPGKNAAVGFVIEPCNRYPGELAQFHIRCDIPSGKKSLVLRVAVPVELRLSAFNPSELSGRVVEVEATDAQTQTVIWYLAGPFHEDTRLDFQFAAQVQLTQNHLSLTCESALFDAKWLILAREAATLNVIPRAHYLRFLPEFYESDDLMNRFLMLFESFWGPIDQQIGEVHQYFDPWMTPTNFLPWLASWFGMTLDPSTPEDRQRILIQRAVSLYQRRGTRDALCEYLEIVTGGKIVIIEHRANDFVLGRKGLLGDGIALGSGNRPHTFTVIARLPSPDPDLPPKDKAFLASKNRRMVEEIIENHKPAHTTYTLRIEPLESEAK